jgi:regulatory protein
MENRKITALKIQKRNPQRVNVYLDGEFAFGAARIVAAWLEVGQEISAEKIQELQAQDAQEVAFQQAVRFLGYRPRTVEEVRRNLSQHEVSDEVISLTIKRLLRSGLLNDQIFAQQWVENRTEFRPRGRRALEFELRSRGISDDIIQRTFQDSFTDEDSLAYTAAQKYAQKLIGLERQVFRRKLGGFLARRGFSYEIAAPVIEQVWQEIGAVGMQGETDFDNEEN